VIVKAARYEGVWENGGIDAHNLNLNSRHKLMDNGTPCTLPSGEAYPVPFV